MKRKRITIFAVSVLFLVVSLVLFIEKVDHCKENKRRFEKQFKGILVDLKKDRYGKKQIFNLLSDEKIEERLDYDSYLKPELGDFIIKESNTNNCIILKKDTSILVKYSYYDISKSFNQCVFPGFISQLVTILLFYGFFLSIRWLASYKW